LQQYTNEKQKKVKAISQLQFMNNIYTGIKECSIFLPLLKVYFSTLVKKTCQYSISVICRSEDTKIQQSTYNCVCMVLPHTIVHVIVTSKHYWTKWHTQWMSIIMKPGGDMSNTYRVELQIIKLSSKTVCLINIIINCMSFQVQTSRKRRQKLCADIFITCEVYGVKSKTNRFMDRK
jgi:hypothetical protein